MFTRTPSERTLPRIRTLACLLALLFAVTGAHAAPLHPPQEEEEAGTAEPAATDEPEGQEEEAAESPGEAAEKNAFKRYFSDWNWLKWLHDTTEGTSRGAARWFDGFLWAATM